MKKMFFILVAATIIGTATIISLKIAAILVVAIVFFLSIFLSFPYILELQDKVEIKRWKKAIEENKKIRERLAKICREVPQEHLV